MTTGWRRGLLRDDGMDAGSVRLVVKLGGSLLGRPGWPREVAGLLDTLPAPRVLVVGGGPLVDGLRAIDAAEPQPVDLVHRLAINCMGLTARFVALVLGSPIVTNITTDNPPIAVLDVPAWLGEDGRYDRLPAGWHVTSDAIAAVVAAACGCGLLLVKSVAPPHGDVEHLASAGWIDGFFPTAARPLAWIGWAAPE